MLQKLEPQVLELYSEADRAVAAYREASGLACPSGCVQCCYSETVEATVLEMLPAAFHLFRSNQAERIWQCLDQEGRSQQCILFRPDLSRPDGGGCTLYPFRALVCRLFGFSGTTDRRGLTQLTRCRHMPVQLVPLNPKAVAAAAAAMPLLHAYGIALTALHPSLGTARRPINDALGEALAKVGLVIDLEPTGHPPGSS